jgi:glycine dehydrogenase subunit 1
MLKPSASSREQLLQAFRKACASTALDIPPGLTEPELIRFFREAGRNATDFSSFLGAGVYRHHIPVVIDALVSRPNLYGIHALSGRNRPGTLRPSSSSDIHHQRQASMWPMRPCTTEHRIGEAILMASDHEKEQVLIARSVHPEYRRGRDHARTLE